MKRFCSTNCILSWSFRLCSNSWKLASEQPTECQDLLWCQQWLMFSSPHPGLIEVAKVVPDWIKIQFFVSVLSTSYWLFTSQFPRIASEPARPAEDVVGTTKTLLVSKNFESNIKVQTHYLLDWNCYIWIYIIKHFRLAKQHWS